MATRTFTPEETQAFLAGIYRMPASANIALCNQAGELLVLKANYKSYWCMPGGLLDEGESPRRAALRELHEEAGITLPDDGLLRFAMYVYRQSKTIVTHLFVFEYKGDVSDQSIKLQAEEISDYKYVSKQYVQQHQDEFNYAVICWSKDFPEQYCETNMTL